jgi:hydrogenase expression/formation protein HypD
MILSQQDNHVDGFLTAGHVCAVTGNEAYEQLAIKFKRPMIVTGFEPADLLFGIYKCVLQLERGVACLENAYKRAVSEKGNPIARKLMEEMLEPVDREWRGIGKIPLSGFALRKKYATYDAFEKFPPCSEENRHLVEKDVDSRCIAGEIMKGNRQVTDCIYFGTVCNPDHPLGAPMVSAEGVCAAYYEPLK